MGPNYFHNADISVLKTYDAATVQTAFNSIVKDYQIEFTFQQGGCQQRAQIVSMLLQKKFNIEHHKIWLFAPAAFDVTDSRTLFIDDNSKLSPDNIVNWNYHVAILVQVLTADGYVETTVIDPSINPSKPITTTQWFDSMMNSFLGKYTFTDAGKYFFDCFPSNNLSSLIFNGVFTDYTDYEKDNLVVEKGLAINDMVISIYRTHILPLMQSTEMEDLQKLEDLKSIFGNATALDLLLAQNISGQTENTTLRYVITNYSAIMGEARAILFKRLTYWTHLLNSLL